MRPEPPGAGFAHFQSVAIGVMGDADVETSTLAARCDELACPWKFESEQQMLEFCGGLFGVVDCPPAALRDALQEHVGFRHEQDRVVLDWRLLYVDLQPA